MSADDAGLAAVEAVRAALEPGRERSEDEPRGFRWWPHAHPQRVRALAPRADGASVVSAETVLLAGVEGRGAELAALAGRNAREAGLSSLRWDSQTGEVSLRAAVVARAGDAGGAARRLAHAALLQVGEALRAADALALELPGASLEAPPAPSPGLPVAAQAEAARAYAEAGAALAPALLDALARLAALAPAPWRRVTRAPHGLDAEIACAAGAGAGPGEGTALLRVSASQPHPRLGPGLVVVLVPPAALEPVPGRASATAALLNEAEAREWTGVDSLGGWCVHPAAGLAHVVFVPALAVEQDTAATLAWQAATRARWALAFAARVAPLRGAGAGPGGS